MTGWAGAMVAAAYATTGILAAVPAAAAGGSITVMVNNVRSDGGRIKVDICPADRFMKPCPLSGIAPAHRGTVAVVIANVPPGRYAAQGIHDLNGNNELDRGAFGIPKEGVGFSRITTRLFRPPAFSSVAFDHAPADQTVTLHLSYYWF